MDNRTAGFSLMESLITLLVLSIGLLGLGQLQARLWVNAGELHTRGDAGLLGANLMEIAPVAWLSEAEKHSAAMLFEPAVSTEISRHRSQPPSDFLMVTDLNVHWVLPSGEHSLSLASTHNTSLDPRGTRWLLPAN
jgi:prepilin-type N-terminal cleavage/methylation domain-containing protein